MQRPLLSPSTPAHAYLELAGVVVVRSALSALLQGDEGEASEVSGAGREEDHCREDRKCVFTPRTR